MLTLTDEQMRLLRDSGDAGPIEVIDPESKTVYILLRADLFARLATHAESSSRDDGDEMLILSAGWD